MWVLEGCKCSHLAGHGVSPWTAQSQFHCLPHTGTSQSPPGWPRRSAGGFLWANVVGRDGEEPRCGASWGLEQGCHECHTRNGRWLRRPRFRPAVPWRVREVLEREMILLRLSPEKTAVKHYTGLSHSKAEQVPQTAQPEAGFPTHGLIWMVSPFYSNSHMFAFIL